MEEKTLLDKLIVQGGIDALYSRANSLVWDLRLAVENLSKRETSHEQRFPDYRTRLSKITALVDAIEETIERARRIERGRVTAKRGV